MKIISRVTFQSSTTSWILRCNLTSFMKGKYLRLIFRPFGLRYFLIIMFMNVSSSRSNRFFGGVALIFRLRLMILWRFKEWILRIKKGFNVKHTLENRLINSALCFYFALLLTFSLIAIPFSEKIFSFFFVTEKFVVVEENWTWDECGMCVVSTLNERTAIGGSVRRFNTREGESRTLERESFDRGMSRHEGGKSNAHAYYTTKGVGWLVRWLLPSERV